MRSPPRVPRDHSPVVREGIRKAYAELSAVRVLTSTLRSAGLPGEARTCEQRISDLDHAPRQLSSRALAGPRTPPGLLPAETP
jgi:hypothetical protein